MRACSIMDSAIGFGPTAKSVGTFRNIKLRVLTTFAFGKIPVNQGSNPCRLVLIQ